MKKFLALIGTLILFTVLYLNKNESEEPSKPKFKISKVSQGSISVKISATGIVEPNFKVEVKSKASGEVLSFPKHEGDRVKKGTLLLKLDKSDEKRNVDKAKSDLSSSTAKLKKAGTALLLQKTKYKTDIKTAESEVQKTIFNLKESEDKLKRQIELFEQKVVSQESLENSQTLYEVNQQKLIQAESQLQQAKDSIHDIAMKENEIELVNTEVQRAEIALDEVEERLEETEIFAPITGVIIEKLVEVGQIIASGISNVNGGTALATIADMSRLFIIADIDETDIGSIKIGHAVTITADAFPDKKFKGLVKRIAPQGLVENSITIFKVKIEVLGKGRKILKPMMSANIDIVTDHVENTILTSRAGIREGENEKFAMVLKNDKPEKVIVKTGIRNPIQVEIVSGLNPEDEVILGDWEKVLEEAKEQNKKVSSLKKILWMIRSK
ncbi:MAG: efflux RND transporter periplasmic adaptor subunit [Nitrospinota bacterium]|nr:efflux RND transporter periplasmic adaptor subunit [Nitrospinota bacterium]